MGVAKGVYDNELTDYCDEELFALYRSTGRPEIKQEIAMRHLHIVKKQAMQMRNVYMGFEQVDDVINEGVVMLMRAIDRFDIGRNVKFETYVTKRIRGMIIDMARDKDWVPRAVRRSYKDMVAATDKYYAINGREPTYAELSELVGVEEDKCREIMGKGSLQSMLSLDIAIDETEDSRKALVLVSDNSEEQPEEQAMDRELKSILAQGIGTLNEKEQMVLALYYTEELNMREISKVMEVSEPRISQIHSNAIRKLRTYMGESVK